MSEDKLEIIQPDTKLLTEIIKQQGIILEMQREIVKLLSKPMMVYKTWDLGSNIKIK